jgi:xylulokinase
MNTPFLAGIDLGTSSLKVALCDEAGRVVSSAAADYPIYAPTPGVAEQDPADWWAALRTALAQALSGCGGRGDSLAAIGLSGQMHGIVPLDQSGQALRRAIIWADQRGADEIDLIEQRVDRATLIVHTGSRASVGFSAPKILWLRRHEPGVFARCAHLLLPKDYLALRLTGEIATEPTDASATLLFDLARRDWSPLLLERLEIAPGLLAPVRPTLSQAGTLTPAAAADLGLPSGIPVVIGAGDTPAQATAYGGLRPGVTLATISSGGQLFAAADQPIIDPTGRVHTLCHVLPDRWYLLGAMQAAGLALRWFRDLFAAATEDQFQLSYEQLTAEAAQVPAGADGLIFLPYLLGERTPHMDNDARAVFFGLTLRHNRAALVRAVMEGVAFAFRDGLEIFAALGLQTNELRLGGGGSRSALWRSICADVFNMPVTLTNADHGAALGAALLAGASIGHFGDLAAVSASVVQAVETVEPHPERAARYVEQYAVFRSLYPCLREQFHAVGKIY